MDGPAGFMAACIQDEFFLGTLRRGISWRTQPITDLPFVESNEACDQLTAEALGEIIPLRFASGEHKRSDGKNELGLPRTRQRLIDTPARWLGRLRQADCRPGGSSYIPYRDRRLDRTRRPAERECSLDLGNQILRLLGRLDIIIGVQNIPQGLVDLEGAADCAISDVPAYQISTSFLVSLIEIDDRCSNISSRVGYFRLTA